MSTRHHPNDPKIQIHVDPPRPAQCLRHHVWMASCPDCRDARIPRQRTAAGGGH